MYIPLTFEAGFSKCLFASGGYEGYFISGSQQYKYHLFTASANLVVQKGTIDSADIYVVGGAGGGAADTTYAGGGGGGGVATSLDTRLFAGTYNITVGRGGGGAGASGNPGASGLNSTFYGSNQNIIAYGGQGGNYGNTAQGGTSGNGLAGGTNLNGNGGGGGGATSAGVSGTSTKAGDGGSGVSIDFANYTYGFGCGGGGFAVQTADTQGYSCNGNTFGEGGNGVSSNGEAGAPNYGMGGGAGYSLGGAGSSGSVMIQYPIYDYCSEYFNETGSCGCRQITFSVAETAPFDPTFTGSFLYTPCGTNTIVSGSLKGINQKTVCATTGTFYTGNTTDAEYEWGYVDDTLSPQCSTGSVCGSIPLFEATCSSSYTTYFNTTAATNGVYYVPRNGTEITFTNMTEQSGSYICASNNYPSGSTTRYSVAVPGVKCLNLRYERTISPASGTQILYWYDCSNTLRSQTFNYPGTNSYNFVASFAISGPWMTTNFASFTQIQYLSVAGDYTGSVPTCGCP